MNHKEHEGHKGYESDRANERGLRPGIAAIPESTELVGNRAIGAAIEVHRVLGPGFLERIYHDALCFELRERSMRFQREVRLSVRYKSIQIPGQRVDLIVEGCVILELKAVVRFEPIHDAMVLSYLKTTGIRLGLLMNFHAPTLREGLRPVDP